MAVEMIDLPEGVPPLATYYVYLTAGCNLACRHCWLAPAFQRNGGTGGHLDYRLFEIAVDEGLPLGLRGVKLTGGEPLLHPDFVRMVDLLADRGVGLTMETNGTLMTPELAGYLKEHSTLSFISVSLDGATAETHDSFRGVPGSFQKACEAVRSLAELEFGPQVIMSIHRGNIDQIEDLTTLAQSLGASSVKFNLVQSSGRGEIMTAHGQVLDVPELIDLGRWVERYLRPRTPLTLLYSWPLAFRDVKSLLDDSSSCGIGSILGILPTGQLALCGIGEHIPDLCYGSLGEDRVADVWMTHPRLLALRQSVPGKLEGVCGECILREQCLGHCVANNYLTRSQLTAPYWFCERAAAEGIFPASRLR